MHLAWGMFTWIHYFFHFSLPLFRLIIFIRSTPGVNGMPLSYWYIVVMSFVFKNHLLSYCLEGVVHMKYSRELWKNVLR